MSTPGSGSRPPFPQPGGPGDQPPTSYGNTAPGFGDAGPGYGPSAQQAPYPPAGGQPPYPPGGQPPYPPAGAFAPTASSGAFPHKSWTPNVPRLIIAGVIVLALIGFVLVKVVRVGAKDLVGTTLPSKTCPSTSHQQSAQPAPNDDLVYGGHLTLPAPADWDLIRPKEHSWFDAGIGAVQDSNSFWPFVMVAGQIFHDDGFQGLQPSAVIAANCFRTDQGYTGVKSQIVTVDSQTEVDGHPAWHLQFELEVNPGGPAGVSGDRVDLLLIDTGDPAGYSFVASTTNLDDPAMQRAMDDSFSQITVEA